MKLFEIKNKISVIDKAIELMGRESYLIRDTAGLCQHIADLIEIKESLIKLYVAIEELIKQSKYQSVLLMYENDVKEAEILSRNTISRKTMYRAISRLNKHKPLLEIPGELDCQVVNHLLGLTKARERA